MKPGNGIVGAACVIAFLFSCNGDVADSSDGEQFTAQCDRVVSFTDETGTWTRTYWYAEIPHDGNAWSWRVYVCDREQFAGEPDLPYSHDGWQPIGGDATSRPQCSLAPVDVGDDVAIVHCGMSQQFGQYDESGYVYDTVRVYK